MCYSSSSKGSSRLVVVVVVVEVVVVIGVVTFYLYIEKLRGAQTVRKNTIFSFARATNTRRVRRRSQFSSSRFSGVSAHTPLCVLFSCICMYIYTHRMYERLGFLLDAIFYLHYFRINIYKARKCKKKRGTIRVICCHQRFRILYIICFIIYT